MSVHTSGMVLSTPEMVLVTPGIVLSTPDIVPATQEMLLSLRSSAGCVLEKLPSRLDWFWYTTDEPSCTQQMPQCSVRMNESIR